MEEEMWENSEEIHFYIWLFFGQSKEERAEGTYKK